MSTLDLVRKISHGPLLSDASLVSESAFAGLANAYFALPTFDVTAVPAWQAMALEAEQQLELLTSHGFTFGVSSDDPYATPWDMFASVENDRHLTVLSTESTGGHPVFSNDENDVFRAVHDIFGHFASQRGFNHHGEEAAYRRHALMFSPLARQAMATETRGQNAALIATGDFASERIGILPNVWRDPYALTPNGPAEWRKAHSEEATYSATR
jgi:hypothetical protein